MVDREFVRRTALPHPADRVFAWHARRGALLMPPFAPVRVVERSGGIEPGARVVLRMPAHSVTNRELTTTLAAVLCRPALLPVPAVVARLALGELADEAVLASTRVVPEKLVGSGYAFRTADLAGSLRYLLGR